MDFSRFCEPLAIFYTFATALTNEKALLLGILYVVFDFFSCFEKIFSSNQLLAECLFAGSEDSFALSEDGKSKNIHQKGKTRSLKKTSWTKSRSCFFQVKTLFVSGVIERLETMFGLKA